MKFLKLICFIFLSIICFGQQKNVKISDLQPVSESTKFPFVSYPEKPLVAEKINTFLQVSNLEFIPGTKENPFDKTQNKKTSYGGYLGFYDWKKQQTPQNILTLQLSGESSGAYSEEFINWANFDLRTGNLINIQDILTPNGIKFIEKKANSDVKNKILKFLKDIKARNSTSKEGKEFRDDQILIYEDCLKFTETSNIYWYDFQFAKDSLVLVRSRCSNHAMRALDDLGTYLIPFSYKELEPYFSDFGKSLILGKGNITKIENPQFKLYKGLIDGKFLIHFLVNEIQEDHSLSITYWYNSQNKPINLRGEFLHNHFSMVEDDYYKEEKGIWIPRANIEADLEGDKIIGTWQDYKTKKYLKLELQEL